MHTDTRCIYVLFAGTCGSSGLSGDGSAATNARLSDPLGVALDTLSNVYIGDQSNHYVRKVTVSTGIISNIAGTSQSEWAQSVILSYSYGFCTLVLVYSTLLTSRTM